MVLAEGQDWEREEESADPSRGSSGDSAPAASIGSQSEPPGLPWTGLQHANLAMAQQDRLQDQARHWRDVVTSRSGEFEDAVGRAGPQKERP